LDFLHGYDFLVSDGEVSEDELDSSRPDLPTSATDIAMLIAARSSITEGLKQARVPSADVLAHVPVYTRKRVAQNYFFLYQIIESQLGPKLSRFTNTASYTVM
jgi:hypothetical protein